MEDFDKPENSSGHKEDLSPKAGESSKEEIGNSRAVKRIELEIWEDSEATFYLELAKIKNSQKPDDETIKSFFDCISYPSDWRPVHENESHAKLRQAWNYVHKADKHSKGDYVRTSLNSFEEFINSQFGQSVLNLYFAFENLKIAAEDTHNIKVKTYLSLLSFLVEGFKNPQLKSPEVVNNNYFHQAEGQAQKIAIELCDDGILKLTEGDQSPVEFELYIQENGRFQKITDAQFKDSPLDTLYLKTEKCVIKVECDESDCIASFLHGATIIENQLNLSQEGEIIPMRFPVENVTSIFKPEIFGNGKAEVDIPAMHQMVETTYKVDLNPVTPIEINKELEKSFTIPENVKKESYLRYRIVKEIFDEVNQCFPDLSAHVKSTITGYLSMPFDIFDTEEQHDDSPRIGSYHAYVRKTVMNILNSKP